MLTPGKQHNNSPQKVPETAPEPMTGGDLTFPDHLSCWLTPSRVVCKQFGSRKFSPGVQSRKNPSKLTEIRQMVWRQGAWLCPSPEAHFWVVRAIYRCLAAAACLSCNMIVAPKVMSNNPLALPPRHRLTYGVQQSRVTR